MAKLTLMSVPVSVGITLLLFSWYLSYAVSIDSAYDFIYNHVSTFYWASVIILLASFFITAIYTTSNTLRWIASLGTVFLIYSSSYFYFMIPGSDSHFFRGLTEYFISTGDLNPTRAGTFHGYYQWPIFFILNKVVVSITGLDLRLFEFILYGAIGFLLATCLYLFASKARANGYAAVVAFFIVISYFFNYQWAPFSIAASFLLLLFVLDRYTSGKRGGTLAILIIFLSMTLTHAFIPVFFVIYCIVMYMINRNRKYLKLFLLSLIIYLTVSIYYEAAFFTGLVEQLTSLYTLEYTGRIAAVLTSSIAPRPFIDVIAQLFSRVTVVATAVVTGLGFMVLVVKRKLKHNDYAILLTGVLYVGVGVLLPVLGERAFFMVAVPASLGASYLVESKLKKYFRPLFLILVVLFTFVLIHETFYDRYTQFQTREAYLTANFMVERYNWTSAGTILSNIGEYAYLLGRIERNTILENDASPSFQELNVDKYNCIIYSVGLEKSLLRYNFSIQETSREIENRFDILYSSGLFYIASRSH